MRNNVRIILVLMMLPLFLGFSSAEEEHASANPMEFVGKVVNFLVLFGGLGFLLYKPIRGFLDQRSRDIEHTIGDTRQTRESAESRLRETRARVKELAGEMEDLRRSSEQAGLENQRLILAEAEKESERLKRMSARDIELLSGIGARELRRFAAGLATRRAAERIQRKLSPEDHVRIIDRSIERLEKLYEKSSSG